MQENRTKPGEKAKHDLNEKTTYRFGNRSFIVEPVFKEETQNTLGYPRLSGTSHYSGRALFPVYMRKPKQARETNCYAEHIGLRPSAPDEIGICGGVIPGGGAYPRRIHDNRARQ